MNPCSKSLVSVAVGLVAVAFALQVQAGDLGGLTRMAKEASKRSEEAWDAAVELINKPTGPKAVANRGAIEVAFSPDHGAEDLVLRVVDSAKADLRVMAYSFTSSKMTAALVRAAKRGVKVYLLADEKQNTGEGGAGKSKAALSTLSLAGVSVRLVGAYPIFHDKVQIADGRTLQTGSYNYSDAAARRNSENVIVHWDNPDLAMAYAEHFERNWRLSKPFTPSF
jgi:phosphatidylserine/phosphatidylglycerophosphate/cardiolipin synthase-like enzyme